MSSWDGLQEWNPKILSSLTTRGTTTHSNWSVGCGCIVRRTSVTEHGRACVTELKMNKGTPSGEIRSDIAYLWLTERKWQKNTRDEHAQRKLVCQLADQKSNFAFRYATLWFSEASEAGSRVRHRKLPCTLSQVWEGNLKSSLLTPPINRLSHRCLWLSKEKTTACTSHSFVPAHNYLSAHVFPANVRAQKLQTPPVLLFLSLPLSLSLSLSLT